MGRFAGRSVEEPGGRTEGSDGSSVEGVAVAGNRRGSSRQDHHDAKSKGREGQRRCSTSAGGRRRGGGGGRRDAGGGGGAGGGAERRRWKRKPDCLEKRCGQTGSKKI